MLQSERKEKDIKPALQNFFHLLSKDSFAVHTSFLILTHTSFLILAYNCFLISPFIILYS